MSASTVAFGSSGTAAMNTSAPPASGAAAKLRVSGLTQRFEQRNGAPPLIVLDDIELSIPTGRFVVLTGASGCGKSTLLRILSGLVRPTAGKVLHDGVAVNGPSRHRGMVFQADAVFPWLTVRDNIRYGPARQRLLSSEVDRLADHWCEVVGLADFRHAYPKELSGGMRKRVDLARVYANDPDVLLMDEPFGALDTHTKHRMQEEVLNLWQSTNKTVVFVTHDLEEAAFLADSVVIMSSRPGRIARVVDVVLPRPHVDEMRLSDEFVAVRREIRSAMKEAGYPSSRPAPQP